MAPAPDAGRLGAPHDGPDRSPRFRRGQRRCPLALAGLLVTFGTPAVAAPLAFDEPEPTRSADGTLQLSWAEALGDELHDYELQLPHEGESRRVYTGRRPEAHVSGLPDQLARNGELRKAHAPSPLNRSSHGSLEGVRAVTPEEALAGVTRNAARALGLSDEIGTIEEGKKADLAVWNAEQPAELAYRIGFNPLHQRIFGDAA